MDSKPPQGGSGLLPKPTFPRGRIFGEGEVRRSVIDPTGGPPMPASYKKPSFAVSTGLALLMALGIVGVIGGAVHFFAWLNATFGEDYAMVIGLSLIALIPFSVFVWIVHGEREISARRRAK